MELSSDLGRRWRATGHLIPGVVLAFIGAACARQEAPPGGPEDRLPPIVVETTPDTFAVVEPGLREIRIRFSERISERATNGQMDDAVVVSPDVGNVRVSHGRDGIDLEFQRGLLADQVYRITVLPVISDMFGNRLQDPFDLVVATGETTFVPNVIAGVVEDRVTGQAVEGVRVEAWFAQETDTIVHWNLTDSDGIFSLRYVPVGQYQIRAFQDRNRDGESGDNEPQTQFNFGALVEEPDTALAVLSVVQPDTSRATLVRVEAVDSTTLVFSLDDFLDPEVPGTVFRGSLNRPEGVVPAVVRLYHEHEYHEYRRQVADSIAEARALQARLNEGLAAGSQESVEGANDPPEAAPVPEPVPARGLEGGADSRQDPRTGLSGLILPGQTLYAVLDSPMEDGVAYEAAVSGIVNIAGVPMGGGSASVVWERPVAPEGDSLGVAADSAASAADTASVMPDSAGAAGDTIGVIPDTAAVDTLTLLLNRGRR